MLTQSISWHRNVWSAPSKDVTIEGVLDSITSGLYEDNISELRNYLSNNDKDKYDAEKLRLPAVTFSGLFISNRRQDCLGNYTSILVLDIDHIASSEIDTTRRLLDSDPYIIASWFSPSGNGIKGLVRLSYTKEYRDVLVNVRHAYGFRMVESYLMSKYGIQIDASGKDITRLCILSSDTTLLRKEKARAFYVEYDEEYMNSFTARITKGKAKILSDNRSSLHKTEGKNKPSDRCVMGSVLKFLEKRRISITGEYINWVKAAYAISNLFTYDVGSKYFLRLCRLDEAMHDEEKSRNLLEYCYGNTRNEVSMGTILFLAQMKGYNRKRGGISTEER